MDETIVNLHYAAERGDIAAVKTLLAAGHNPNAFDEISYTPLHYAARDGHFEIIKLLLQAGADVNARDEPRIGDTPLGSVAGSCSFAIAQALLSAGADPTIRAGCSFAHWTAQRSARPRKAARSMNSFARPLANWALVRPNLGNACQIA